MRPAAVQFLGNATATILSLLTARFKYIQEDEVGRGVGVLIHMNS